MCHNSQSASLRQQYVLLHELGCVGEHGYSGFGHIGLQVGYRPVVVVGGASVFGACGAVYVHSRRFAFAQHADGALCGCAELVVGQHECLAYGIGNRLEVAWRCPCATAVGIAGGAYCITAFISVALAFMNILPIPALDGGHALFVIIEMLTGKKPSEKVLEYSTMVGLGLLLVLLLYANGNDIYRFFIK